MAVNIPNKEQVSIPDLVDRYIFHRTRVTERGAVNYVLGSCILGFGPNYGQREVEEIERKVRIIFRDRENAGGLKWVASSWKEGNIYAVVE